VIEIVRRSIVELCSDDHHGDEATLSQWLGNKTPAHFRQWIGNQDNHCVVGLLDGALAGVGLLRRSGAARTGEILLMYLKPEATRRGLGRAIHAALEARAREWQLAELHLGSTRNARCFYEGLGYRSTGDPRHVVGVLSSHPYRKALAGG
jgi:GNAT superfamily N-acetyltransferase